MGNSIFGNDRNSNHVTLGRHAAIDVTKEEHEIGGGGSCEKWTVSYTINDSSCTLTFEKFVDKRDRVSAVFLDLKDDICAGGGISIWIERGQTNFLEVAYECSKNFRDMMEVKTNETSNSRCYVVKTRVFHYGRRGKGGLVVAEWEKKSRNDEYPYTLTVAHYYAISSGNVFGQVDIGLSMIVNFRVLNNNLHFTVEGPDRHPSSALFYMFDQASRSGSWKPTACPHCADTERQQSARQGFLNYGGGLLENKEIRGDHNGNIIAAKEMTINNYYGEKKPDVPK